MLTYFGKNSVLDVYHGSDYTSRKSLLLQIKSMYWFLYDRDLRLERVKYVSSWFLEGQDWLGDFCRTEFLWLLHNSYCISYYVVCLYLDDTKWYKNVFLYKNIHNSVVTIKYWKRKLWYCQIKNEHSLLLNNLAISQDFMNAFLFFRFKNLIVTVLQNPKC